MSATAENLIRSLSARGVQLSRKADRLLVEAPAGTVTTELRQLLADRKGELLAALDQRARVSAIAECAGFDPEFTQTLTTEEIDFCAPLDDLAVRSYLHVVRDARLREAGKAPPDETSAAMCSQCGPVLVHAVVARVAPVVDGMPRVIGCPWCTNRARGLPIPRPPLSCGACRHFVPDALNPLGGVGACELGLARGVPPYPAAKRSCASWQPVQSFRIKESC